MSFYLLYFTFYPVPSILVLNLRHLSFYCRNKPFQAPFKAFQIDDNAEKRVGFYCNALLVGCRKWVGDILCPPLPTCATHNTPLSHPTTKVHGHCSPNLSQVHCTPYSYPVSNARHCLNWIFRQHRPLECKGMDDKCIASTIFTRTKTKTKTKTERKISGTSQQRFPTTTSRLATNWCNNQIGDIRPQTQDWRRKSAKN